MDRMDSYGTSYSGYGGSASAGYEPLIGFYAGMAVYIGYAVVGILIMMIAPKAPPADQQANN